MKYAPPGDQEEFYENMLKHARTESERACIMLLWRTGMHASTLCDRKFSVNWAGDCEWRRPKTGKRLRARLPMSEAKIITRCIFAGLLPASTSTLRRWVARIGDRAGYAAVSPITFRHSRAVWLRDGGMKREDIAEVMGCSMEVLRRHYGQLGQEELMNRMEQAAKRHSEKRSG